MQHKKLLIFDFDGTIADTLRVVVSIVNEIGPEFGVPELTTEQFIELKHKSIPELLQLAGVSWAQLPLIIKRGRDRFRHHMSNVTPIPQMPEVLSTLAEQEYKIGILTSNSKKNVRHFLQVHSLEYFEFVRAPRSLFGKSRAIKDILKRYELNQEDVVMIGDEVRDIDAAQKAGTESIAVSWGFNSEELLIKADPTQLISDPHELLTLFSN